MYQSTAAASSAFNSAAGGRRRQIQNLLAPLEAFGGVPPNQPEVLQTPDDVGRFGGTSALDEPPQRAAVVLEIVAHAVQPFGLRKSDQPLGGTSSVTGAIARQRLQGVVALAGRRELECRVRPHGFEHLVQWTSRH